MPDLVKSGKKKNKVLLNLKSHSMFTKHYFVTKRITINFNFFLEMFLCLIVSTGSDGFVELTDVLLASLLIVNS